MDLFSCYVVAWMVSRKENSQLAQQLMEQTLTRYGLTNPGVTLHQDRGSPMIAESFLDLMADVGVVCSHGRPRVSNDNPFSESQFKTLKTHPDFPGRFDSPESARLWAVDYFCWYNHEHHHRGLADFTSAQVYTGNYQAVSQMRQTTLDRYYKDHLECFCRGRPKAALPPEAVQINPITSEVLEGETSTDVNFPTLPAAQKALERANRGYRFKELSI
jgi:putative transposase